MKKLFFIIPFFLLSFKGYSQIEPDTTGMTKAIAKFKLNIIGTWHSDGLGPADQMLGAVYDAIFHKSLPFKTRDKIVFQKNGFFKVNNSKTLKRYEVINKASSFNYNGTPFWTYAIRLDGVEYFAHFENGSFSLGYQYDTGSWIQPLRKKN